MRSSACFRRYVALAIGAGRGGAKFPFLISSHVLRHSCGYKLANDGQLSGLSGRTPKGFQALRCLARIAGPRVSWLLSAREARLARSENRLTHPTAAIQQQA